MRSSVLSFSLLLALAGAGPVFAADGVPATVATSSTLASNGEWSLGAVTDVRRAGADGVVVLAVTPGSAAERMGLRTGDRLRTVNGADLTGALEPGRVLSDALANGGGKAVLGVVREGRQVTLTGRLDGAPVASTTKATAATGCGYVSTVGSPPRLTERVFEGEITMIDGDSTPLRPDNRYRVSAGRHVLVVRELIDAHRFTSAQRLQISLLKRRENARAYKAVVIDVAPGTRYSIGARLLPDKLDNASIRANAYWEPVVWKTTAEACR